MKSGDMTAGISGMVRTHNLPPGVKQSGDGAAVLEIRGGLPIERAEAGATFMAPWFAKFDGKYQLLDEDRYVPALSFQATLGMVQDDIAACLLAGKSAGPFELTGMLSRGRAHERLWLPGKQPFGSDSEAHVKDYYAWGGLLETAITPVNRFFVYAVAWDPFREREVPVKEENEFGVNEGVAWFFGAGLRVLWALPPPKVHVGAVTVLRGFILEKPEIRQFIIGQPGIFRATVLVDASTSYTKLGEPAAFKDLKKGGAVLIQGIPLPKASTFYARTIELQSK